MASLPRVTTAPACLYPVTLAFLVALSTWQSCCPLPAAQVLAVPERSACGSLAIATWDCGNTLIALQPDGSAYRALMPGGRRAEALAFVRPSAVVVLCGGQTLLLSWAGPTPAYTLVSGGPADVHSAVGVGENRFVAISGGRHTTGGLDGAQASLWELLPRCRKLCDTISPRVNPQSVTAGHLGDNGFGDNDAALGDNHAALFSVCKPAILDPTVRLRPWIYSLAGERLVALWKGSSFSQPYMAAAFADLCPLNSGDEVCTLELTRDGQHQITIYRWHGFIMEGIARSAPALFGQTLRAGPLGNNAGEGVFAWRGSSEGCIVGLSVGDWPEGGLAALRQYASTQRMRRPLAWDIGLMDGQPVAFVLSGDGSLRAMPVRTETPK